jgi:PIN domain
LAHLIEVVDESLYEEHEAFARERMLSRDVRDWPIVATSLLLDCPVWTEDQDFFGSGVATRTTNNVELYLIKFRVAIAQSVPLTLRRRILYKCCLGVTAKKLNEKASLYEGHASAVP